MWKVGESKRRPTTSGPASLSACSRRWLGKRAWSWNARNAEVAGALHNYSPEQLVAAERETQGTYVWWSGR